MNILDKMLSKSMQLMAIGLFVASVSGQVILQGSVSFCATILNFSIMAAVAAATMWLDRKYGIIQKFTPQKLRGVVNRLTAEELSQFREWLVGISLYMLAFLFFKAQLHMHPKTLIILTAYNVIANWVPIMSMLVLVVWLVLQYMIDQRTETIQRAFRSAACLVLVMAVIEYLLGQSGDGLLAWAYANPNGTIGVVSAIALFFFAVRITPISFGRTEVVAASAGFQKSPGYLSELDGRIIAVHESGHALLLAGVYENIPDITASIVPDLSSLGRILLSDALLQSTSMLEWNMMLSLGGNAAEYVLFGERYSGSGRDFTNWEGYARQFLLITGAEPFFADPQNPHESETNARSLTRMKDGQMAKVREYLNINRDILDELAQTLQKEKTLQRDGLIGFLTRAQRTELIRRQA